MSALVQVMAWCQTGTKPLPEPMMTQSINVYVFVTRHRCFKALTWLDRLDLGIYVMKKSVIYYSVCYKYQLYGLIVCFGVLLESFCIV